MEDQRKNELAVIIAETVAFGFFERSLLVRIPYMVFGDFSSGFISIVLWWVYNSVFILCRRVDCMDREIRST